MSDPQTVATRTVLSDFSTPPAIFPRVVLDPVREGSLVRRRRFSAFSIPQPPEPPQPTPPTPCSKNRVVMLPCSQVAALKAFLQRR